MASTRRENSQALLENQQAWPNFSQTASLLKVDPSTISKQAGYGRITFVRRGLGPRGNRCLPPSEVLRLARSLGKVPMAEVREKLAQELAARISAPVAAVRRALESLEETFVGAPTPESGPALPEGNRRMNSTSSRITVVPMGQLEPRLVGEGEVPSAEFSRAVDALRPHEPEGRVLVAKPRIVWRGRKEPGDGL